MKIIKRNGAEVPFDITKIITAVTKASDSVGGQSRLSREQITQIAAAVTDQCQQLNRAVSVEEVQDLVENQLMDIQAHDVARHYITYRYIQFVGYRCAQTGISYGKRYPFTMRPYRRRRTDEDHQTKRCRSSF